MLSIEKSSPLKSATGWYEQKKVARDGLLTAVMRFRKKFSPCKIVKQFQRKRLVSHELIDMFINNCGKQKISNKNRQLEPFFAIKIKDFFRILRRERFCGMAKCSCRFRMKRKPAALCREVQSEKVAREDHRRKK